MWQNPVFTDTRIWVKKYKKEETHPTKMEFLRHFMKWFCGYCYFICEWTYERKVSFWNISLLDTHKKTLLFWDHKIPFLYSSEKLSHTRIVYRHRQTHTQTHVLFIQKIFNFYHFWCCWSLFLCTAHIPSYRLGLWNKYIASSINRIHNNILVVRRRCVN